jgi:serine/threonine-protein kinase
MKADDTTNPAESSTTAWHPGTVLGPYVLTSWVGAGGMGEVWKASDSRLDRRVAVKRLKAPDGRRFEQEARSIAALNHPHICQIYDVGPDYLVLEYIEGEPVRGPLPADVATRLAIQIASALEEAHRHGLVHRDLKPSNILLTGTGAAKLLDFGLAATQPMTGDTRTAGSDPSDWPTREDGVAGTPSYMSPEQAQGLPIDHRSDVFSLGAVLYEMLTGTRAFDGRSIADVLHAVIHDEPAQLSTAPKALAAIVVRCLRKSPADRFGSMTQVRTALVAVSDSDIRSSIAVLPFANLSADSEEEYFSDGLADEIIHALTQVGDIKVTARTSAFAFKGQDADVRRIAETLGVGHLLEGSVRTAGTRLRVTAQLIAASDGMPVWSERYDRDLDDVFAIQDEIARAITAALRVKLRPASAGYVPRPEAHEALLKGRYHLAKATRDAIRRAGEYFEEAVRLDPTYAAAHAARGSYYWMLAPPAIP